MFSLIPVSDGRDDRLVAVLLQQVCHIERKEVWLFLEGSKVCVYTSKGLARESL